jgi:hypothetical protein
MSNTSSLIDSVSSAINTGNDNFYQAYAAKQQKKQFAEKMELEKERFGLEKDEFALQKLMEMYQLRQAQASDEWRRQFRNALGTRSATNATNTAA